MGRRPSDLVVLTFNILCPVYKRLGPEHGGMRRESESPALWKPRMAAVIAEILACQPTPDVICLQEFWFAPESVQLFRDAFAASYTFFFAKRPGKEDGLATLVRKRSRAFLPSTCGVITPSVTHEFSLLPGSDRVALLVALRLAPPSLCPNAPPEDHLPRDLVIVNTHLTFPHGTFLHRLRLEQARSLSRTVSAFAASALERSNSSAGCDAIILGDFNGDPRSRVCSHLRYAGYGSCLADVWNENVEPATHRNHLGESVFVDHVFLRRFFPSSVTQTVPQGKPCRLPLSFLFSRNTTGKKLRSTESTCSLLTAPMSPSSLRGALLRRTPFRKTRRTLNSESAMMIANADSETNVDNDAKSLSSEGSVKSATLTRLDSEEMGGLGPKLSRDKPMSMSMSAIDDGASVLACSVAPVNARVLPDGVCSKSWPAEARCSDHRPVCVEFRYSWSVIVRDEDNASFQITNSVSTNTVAGGLCPFSKTTL